MFDRGYQMGWGTNAVIKSHKSLASMVTSQILKTARFRVLLKRAIIIIIIIIIIIKCCAKGSGKEVKMQEFMYRDTTNVEPEMYDCTSNNWSHWNSNEKLKEKFGNYTRKTFDRFTTKDSYTWNITHNTESTAVWSLKPERWGSLLDQEKYQEEKGCDKRHSYRIIIIIIIIIIIEIYTFLTLLWSLLKPHWAGPDSHQAPTTVLSKVNVFHTYRSMLLSQVAKESLHWRFLS